MFLFRRKQKYNLQLIFILPTWRNNLAHFICIDTKMHSCSDSINQKRKMSFFSYAIIKWLLSEHGNYPHWLIQTSTFLQFFYLFFVYIFYWHNQMTLFKSNMNIFLFLTNFKTVFLLKTNLFLFLFTRIFYRQKSFLVVKFFQH